MAVSREVQSAVDQIHKDKDLISSMRKAKELRDQQYADLQAQIDAKQSLSDEDRKALTDAVSEMQDADAAASKAVPANVDQSKVGNGAASGQAGAQVGGNEGRDGSAEPINSPTGQPVPLMPNSAFDPDPTGARGVGNPGQPNQAPAIETAGGFVVQGGGATHRAAGSDPTSPSSSLVVPLDPDAKAPANNADLLKSGLGDSSQNALLGNDGRPIEEGVGIPREPSQFTQEGEQKRQDALNAEQEARRANPLNLAPEGTPQAGSPEAAKAATEQQRKDQEAAVAKAQEQARSDAEQGKPAPEPAAGSIPAGQPTAAPAP